jgi:hypothetical protein
MSASRNQSVAKVKVVENLPPLGNVEIGEVYYDIANTRLAVRLVTGWVYFSQDV